MAKKRRHAKSGRMSFIPKILSANISDSIRCDLSEAESFDNSFRPATSTSSVSVAPSLTSIAGKMQQRIVNFANEKDPIDYEQEPLDALSRSSGTLSYESIICCHSTENVQEKAKIEDQPQKKELELLTFPYDLYQQIAVCQEADLHECMCEERPALPNGTYYHTVANGEVEQEMVDSGEAHEKKVLLNLLAQKVRDFRNITVKTALREASNSQSYSPANSSARNGQTNKDHSYDYKEAFAILECPKSEGIDYDYGTWPNSLPGNNSLLRDSLFTYYQLPRDDISLKFSVTKVGNVPSLEMEMCRIPAEDNKSPMYAEYCMQKRNLERTQAHANTASHISKSDLTTSCPSLHTYSHSSVGKSTALSRLTASTAQSIKASLLSIVNGFWKRKPKAISTK